MVGALGTRLVEARFREGPLDTLSLAQIGY